jgi:phage/plasmid primase-like uncharacterized protein
MSLGASWNQRGRSEGPLPHQCRTERIRAECANGRGTRLCNRCEGGSAGLDLAAALDQMIPRPRLQTTSEG